MKTHIISGAGSGIGQAIAQKLSQNSDNHLVLIGRTQTRLEDTMNSLKNPDQHKMITASVTKSEELKKGFAALDLDKKNVTSVIANAGVGGPNQYGPEDRWDEIIDINVKGCYILGNEALPYLKSSQEKYKNILLISSVVAHLGVPSHSAYCTSKAAILGLMRSWAAEWSQHQILVNAICPGWVDTQMAQNGIQGIADQMEKPYDEALKEQMQLLPLKKMSTPSEIANLCNFFVSGEQCSITGEEIQINNGGLMH